MNKKRLLISLLVLVACTAGALAQVATPQQRLVVWQRSGEKVYFDLEEEPETTFENGLLTIKTTTTSASYQLENVLRYTYEGAMTAIDAPIVRPGEIRFSQSKDGVRFDGLAEGTPIEIYALDGKSLGRQTAHSGQPVVVSLATQPRGTYLIKVDKATYKFMKQ